MEKKRKNWLKEHWAEILFLIFIVLAIYFVLKGAGYFG